MLYQTGRSDHILIQTGAWGRDDESVSWGLFQSVTLPSAEDCTAVFCVAITGDQRMILVKERRGWGMPGGHIEPGETLVEALQRECTEEAGFKPKNPRLFAYRKITAQTPITHPDPNRKYPFPVSYIAYYVAQADKISPHSEPDILEVKALTMAELSDLNSPDYATIELGWNHYTQFAPTHK